MPIGGLLGNDTGWWLNPTNQMDGINPDLFADPTGMRYMLNQREVTAADIFALSSAAGKRRVAADLRIVPAAANEIRIDHRYGVPEQLHEGPYTQFIRNGSDIGDGPFWSSGGASGTTFNAGVGPETPIQGLNFSEQIRNGNSGAWRAVNAVKAASALPFGAYFVVKKRDLRYAAFRMQGTSPANVNATLDMDTGQWSVTPAVNGDFSNPYGEIIPLFNGSYLVFISATTDATTSLSAMVSFNNRATATISANADDAGGGFYAICQITNTSRPMSYVPNDSGSTVPVTADIVPLTAAARDILLASAGAAVWRGICPIRNATIFISKGTARMLGPTSNVSAAQTQPIDLTAAAGTGDWSVGAGACVTWGASGRRLGMGGGTVVSDANPIASGATIHLGNSTGIPAGQVLRLRQFAAWTLADRATEAAVQAQARAA
jgi:hypothetical protein